MESDLIIEVLDPSGVLPATGDTSFWFLAALALLSFGIVFFLVRQRRLKKGTNAFLSALLAMALCALLVGTGGALTSFAANNAADNTLKITITKGQKESSQSTVELPLVLSATSQHGSSVFLSCKQNDLDKVDFAATLNNPSTLPNDTVGFALVANPAPTKENTVANGFSASYKPAHNVSSDAHLFAALPKQDML
ncbi:MAG: LPXTG cell wall anchor domain-containing protein, partial [Coriobacteriales bacterium]|nr:LPXTG cell wall anchor domain-containing protein [Coriobacteriales bacterium]